MVECEICMEKFPIDCFEFFPCAHKLCQFCYHNIKQLKCPYCRLDLEPVSVVEREYDPDYDPDYYTIPELPATFVTNINRRRNRRRNRRNTQRNSNNQLMLSQFNETNISNASNSSSTSNASDTSLESNSSNMSNESNSSNMSNKSYRRNINNLRNTTERFTTNTSVNNNHFSLLTD